MCICWAPLPQHTCISAIHRWMQHWVQKRWWRSWDRNLELIMIILNRMSRNVTNLMRSCTLSNKARNSDYMSWNLFINKPTWSIFKALGVPVSANLHDPMLCICGNIKVALFPGSHTTKQQAVTLRWTSCVGSSLQRTAWRMKLSVYIFSHLIARCSHFVILGSRCSKSSVAQGISCPPSGSGVHSLL